MLFNAMQRWRLSYALWSILYDLRDGYYWRRFLRWLR